MIDVDMTEIPEDHDHDDHGHHDDPDHEKDESEVSVDKSAVTVDKSAVTVVVTACGRPDLLAKTLKSFFKYNTFPISEYIIIEDSGRPAVNDELKKLYPNLTWLDNESRMGQIKSIDKAYKHVKTKWIFHLEDDWECYESGFIEESLEILKNNEKISTVMCRAHGKGYYQLSDQPPILDCRCRGWGYYSFNPGLRRTADYKDLFGKSYYKLCSSRKSLNGELVINNHYQKLGYRMAMTKDPRGYFRHLGDGRHVAN